MNPDGDRCRPRKEEREHFPGPTGEEPGEPGGEPGAPPEGLWPPDLAMGAFSEKPPWDLTGKPLPWRDEMPLLRAQVAAQVPKLLQRRRLPPGERVLVTSARLGWAILAWRLVEKRQANRVGRREISRAGLSPRLRKS